MKSFEIMPTHILLDLGVSSFQLDKSNRGFTFQLDEPLDMRMNLTGTLTAKHVLNEYDQKSLIQLFSNNGDIHRPEKLVNNIINRRSTSPLLTTFDLKDCVKGAFRVNSRARFISMLTKVFQAVRVEVNKEMDDLDCFLKTLLNFKDITVAIITFQPNEDRRIKHFVKENGFQKVTKKPIQMSYHECKENPRSKTAKLRIFKI